MLPPPILYAKYFYSVLLRCHFSIPMEIYAFKWM